MRAIYCGKSHGIARFLSSVRRKVMSSSESKMATGVVKKMLLTMGIPMIFSMMLQALYNIVDSAFVSNMRENGELALNALTLAFPVQMLMVAVGIGTGVGVNALIAKCLGQGNRDKANKVAGNAIFLGIIIYAVFLLFGLFGTGAYVRSQTSNREIIEMASGYLKICCIASFGIVFYSLYEKIIQATGRSMYSTIAQVSGAVLNIILDPIMIYGLLGCPELGVNGAAYATIIGQIVSFVLDYIFHIKFDIEIDNGIKYIKPDKKIIWEIYTIGLPAIIAQALMSVMTYALNIIFGTVDERVVTAYGLYYKIQQFILFAAFGLRDAITPIVSFNYGMEDKRRIKEGIKYGLIYTLVIMSIGLVVLEMFANIFTSVFGLSGETESLCISAIRIISLSFLFAGTNIAMQGCFQALGDGMASLIISVLRQFLLVVPVAWLFALLVKYVGASQSVLWITFLIGEGLSAIVSVILIKRVIKNKVDVIN